MGLEVKGRAQELAERARTFLSSPEGKEELRKAGERAHLQLEALAKARTVKPEDLFKRY
jgi:hypothetical protein